MEPSETEWVTRVRFMWFEQNNVVVVQIILWIYWNRWGLLWREKRLQRYLWYRTDSSKVQLLSMWYGVCIVVSVLDGSGGTTCNYGAIEKFNPQSGYSGVRIGWSDQTMGGFAFCENC